MAWQGRISSLEGANAFWNRYGIVFAEHGRSEYIATFSSDRTLISYPPVVASTLTELWESVGDMLIPIPSVEVDR